jgi:hypothetical protein
MTGIGCAIAHRAAPAPAGVQQVASHRLHPGDAGAALATAPQPAVAMRRCPKTSGHARRGAIDPHSQGFKRSAMNANTPREFYRSEAFPEDVADLVSPTPTAAARREQRMNWMMLGLVPLGLATAAAAVGVVVTLFSRVF